MGQMSWRHLLTIVSLCTMALGLVGLSETIHPSRTALGASSLAIRLFGPVILIAGIALFAASRRIPKRAYPRASALVATGALTVAAPFVLWLAGVLLAPEDGAIWAPMIAVALFLLALPGVGMLFGGLRRLREPEVQPKVAQPVSKVRKRR